MTGARIHCEPGSSARNAAAAMAAPSVVSSCADGDIDDDDDDDTEDDTEDDGFAIDADDACLSACEPWLAALVPARENTKATMAADAS